MSDPVNTSVATKQAGGNEVIRMSMETVAGFEALQRAANLLSASTLVPVTYRRWVCDKDGNRTGDNPSGLANCVVALNMSARMGADPIMVCQNLHVIEGRPSWSSMFVIASINQCGKFSPIRFDLSAPGEEVEAKFTYVEWVDGSNGKRRPEEKIGTMKVRHQTCSAWVIEKATGERLDGPTVSMQLALDEGWIQKKGSKWRTMPEVMLRYRAASLFGKLYAPELLMGLQSREELEDIIEVDTTTGEVTKSHSSPSKAPKIIPANDGWTLESMEAFDDLMDKAYMAFKDAGYGAEYEAFAQPWRAKRNKADAAATIEDLAIKVKALTAPIPSEPASDPQAADGSLFPSDESGK